ncbi:hypothetical protein RS9917_04118 [Synechococcus sp. RS9917]|nr:hypothetical protein RS9917_04118 [Synechococcus sp. RS9917]
MLLFWGVVAQAEQFRKLLPQQRYQWFPLAAGIGPDDSNWCLLCISADVAAMQFLN